MDASSFQLGTEESAGPTSPLADLAARLSDLPGASLLETAILLECGRELVRLSVAGDRSRPTADSLTQLGLRVRVAGFAMVPDPSLAIGEYSLSARITDRLESPHVRHVLYVAREASRLAEAEAAEQASDCRLGVLLGYPDCCVGHFKRHRAQYLTGFAPCFQADPGPWPWWSNTVMEVFGWRLLSHFPCRPDCSCSRRVAGRHLKALRSFDPVFTLMLLNALRSQVFWSPSFGVAFARSADQRTGSGTLCNLVHRGPSGEEAVHATARWDGCELAASDVVLNSEPLFWMEHVEPDPL